MGPAGPLAHDDPSTACAVGVNLFECKEYAPGVRPPKWNRCSYGAFAPARRLSEHADGALEFSSAAGPQRPALLHVAGNPPDQTKARRLAPLKPWLGRVLSRCAGDTLEREPILLLSNPAGADAPAGCDVTALGRISTVPTRHDIAAGLGKLAF